MISYLKNMIKYMKQFSHKFYITANELKIAQVMSDSHQITFADADHQRWIFK